MVDRPGPGDSPITFPFRARTSVPGMPDSQGETFGPSAGRDGSVAASAPVGQRDLAGKPELQPPGPQVEAWAGEVSGRVVDGVGWLRARTTVPIVRALRAIAYGLVVVVALVTALVLMTIGLVRMWDVYLPLHPVGRRVWLGYVVLGAVLVLAGGALLARRSTSKREP